jgi:FimV-like protein
MGDKEAARVILEEVIAHGSEDQQAEASKMKDFL